MPAGRTRADLDQFWTDWEPLIRRVARKSLSEAGVPQSLATVDDAEQHVYVQLLDKWEEVQEPGRFALGYVLKLYIFAQVRELKHRSNTPLHREDSIPDQAEAGPTMEDCILEREIEELLRAALPEALEALPDTQRQAVELTTSGEYSRAEAGAAMSIAPGTVSSHRTRGLRKLAGILGPIIICFLAQAINAFDAILRHWV